MFLTIGRFDRQFVEPPTVLRFVLFCLAAANFGCASFANADEWYRRDGRSVQADWIRNASDAVHLRLDDGKIIVVPLSSFDEATRELALAKQAELADAMTQQDEAQFKMVRQHLCSDLRLVVRCSSFFG